MFQLILKSFGVPYKNSTIFVKKTETFSVKNTNNQKENEKREGKICIIKMQQRKMLI